MNGITPNILEPEGPFFGEEEQAWYDLLQSAKEFNGGTGGGGPVAASQVTTTAAGFANVQLVLDQLLSIATGDQVKRIQYPAYTLNGTAVTAYASFQAGLATIGGNASSTVYSRPIHLTGAADAHTLNSTYTRRIAAVIGDAVEPAVVNLNAGVSFSLAIDATRVSFAGPGVLSLLATASTMGLNSGEAAHVALNGVGGLIQLTDYRILEWSNPSGHAYTVELYGTSAVPAAPYPTGVTVLDKTNVRRDQLSSSGSALLDSDNFIAPEFLRPVAFQGYELGPAPADGDPQTFIVVPAEMVAALQPDLDEAINAQIEEGGGTPGGGGTGLGAPFAMTNFTATDGVVSSTDSTNPVLAVWDLVAGAESRVSMTVGDTSVSGKLILDRVRALPDGTGFYGIDLGVFKNYGGAGVAQAGSASTTSTGFSTPNGVATVLGFHRHEVGGVDTITVEGSADAGATWTVFDTMLPEAGVDYFIKYAAAAGETAKELAHTGYVPSV